LNTAIQESLAYLDRRSDYLVLDTTRGDDLFLFRPTTLRGERPGKPPWIANLQSGVKGLKCLEPSPDCFPESPSGDFLAVNFNSYE